MKIKKVLRSILIVLLILQTQSAFAEWFNFINEFEAGNYRSAERRFSREASTYSSDDLRRCFRVIVGRFTGNELVRWLDMFPNRRYGNSPIAEAIKVNNRDAINYLISKNIRPTVLCLELALTEGYSDIFELLLRNGGDIDQRGYDDSRTFLMFWAGRGNFNIVKTLIENGAKVNLRDANGSTAASIAYDRGEIEIFNYLKEHGAIDFEPLQVTQQPSTPAQSTTVIVQQPSTSAQSAQTQQPERNVGREIAESFRSPLQSGTYALAGTQDRIRITAVAKSGIITQTWQGQNYQGTYNIDGIRMTVQIRGFTFVFNITSETSFSGHGENWVRIGF